MRKVMIKRLRAIQYSRPEDQVDRPGLFHQWGTDFEEYENGAAQFSVGIVELEDGSVEMVPPERIHFLEPADKEVKAMLSLLEKESDHAEK